MAEILSLQECQARYEKEWVLIDAPEVDAALNVQRGHVLWHSKDWAKVYRQARKLKP